MRFSENQSLTPACTGTPSARKGVLELLVESRADFGKALLCLSSLRHERPALAAGMDARLRVALRIWTELDSLMEQLGRDARRAQLMALDLTVELEALQRTLKSET